MTRHFLTLLDFSPEELSRLIGRGIELKRMREAGTIYEPLRSRTLAMVFDLKSTRTRVAFEAGMQQLGGHAIFLSPNDTQLGRGEPIERYRARTFRNGRPDHAAHARSSAT